MKIFTIFDSKAEAFLPPFTSRTNATAIRNFTAAANTEDHDFHTHAADYTLFQIGTFDEIRGLVIPRGNGSENLGTALQFLQQSEFAHPMSFDRTESETPPNGADVQATPVNVRPSADLGHQPFNKDQG